LLLEDSLAPEQQEEVIEHLDDCAECQRSLERLAADVPWWEELRGLKGATRPVPLAALALGAAFRPCTSSSTGSWPSAGGDGPYLGFLDASEDPTCLGRLGPFAVTSLLGQGGMGIVLSAFDPVLDRPVAIKVLAPHFASSAAARQRFAREARAAAAVVHPHVVPIHSVDSWKGLPYLVMSHVAGRSLQERLAIEGPLPLEEVLRIGVQAAEGLAAAHEQGLVHRDVKPANILLEDGTGRVLLTDFGLARAADDASLTQSGIIAGTPQYMAPEQARGEAVDHRADLFSLGSTLYVMYTGRHPFGADAPLAVVRRVCDERPPAIRSLVPTVPPWLAAIIERLHAKSPEARFQSASEVSGLLAGCLAHVRQRGAVPLPAGLPAVWPHHRRRQAVGIVLAVFLLLALVGASVFPWAPGPQPEKFPQGDRTSVRDQRPKLAPAARGAEPVDEQLQEMRQHLGGLEADLNQPAGRPAEPTLGEVDELNRRLEALRRELTGK
jgi:serine/threonine-protein kinase